MFVGIGCLEGTYRTNIDPFVSPVVNPPSKIPFTQRGKVKEERDRMESKSLVLFVKQKNQLNGLVL